jgi:transcriptional regulator with XRE-family HTH domain
MSPLEEASPALAAVIRRLREENGLTQEDLAYEAGVTTGTLSKIERGLTNPAWTTVERIAGALGVSLGEFGAAVDRAEGS